MGAIKETEFRSDTTEEFLERMDLLDQKIKKINAMTRYIGDNPNEFMKKQPKLLRISEASIELGLSRKTLELAIKKGQINTVTIGNSVMINRGEINRLENNECNGNNDHTNKSIN